MEVSLVESKKELLEQVTLDCKEKKAFLFFWKNYFKKIWSLYLIGGAFTIVFVILYFRGNPSALYFSIAYPILVLVLVVVMGIWKYIKYLKRKQKNDSSILVEVYTDCIKLTNSVEGRKITNEIPYDRMEKIFFKESTKEIVFQVQKTSFFSIEESDVKPETLAFLKTLFSKKKER